jgi:hypothetical protein
MYCRTFNHSTMGVATGNAIHHTHFEVPRHVPHGEYRLVVIANGIASHPIDVRVEHDRHHHGDHDGDHSHDHGHDEEIVQFDHEEAKYKDKDAKEAKEKEKDFKDVKEKDTKEFKDKDKEKEKEKDCKDVEQKHCVEHKHCKEKDQKEHEQKCCKEKDSPEQVCCPPHERSRDYDELVHRLGRIVERLERVEDEARRRPFIRAEERPHVGERALRQDEGERLEHRHDLRAEEHHRHEQEGLHHERLHGEERLQEEERLRHEAERHGAGAATHKPAEPVFPHKPEREPHKKR